MINNELIVGELYRCCSPNQSFCQFYLAVDPNFFLSDLVKIENNSIILFLEEIKLKHKADLGYVLLKILYDNKILYTKLQKHKINVYFKVL